MTVWRIVRINKEAGPEHWDLYFDGWRYATTDRTAEQMSTVPIADYRFLHKTLEAAHDVIQQLGGEPDPDPPLDPPFSVFEKER